MEKNINLYDKNNELIARFLGLNIITDGISLFDTNYKPLAKYHESWNDLMPVVEKISLIDEVDEFNIYIDASKISDYVEIRPKYKNSFYTFNISTGTKIEQIYNIIIKFIKWYNQNKS